MASEGRSDRLFRTGMTIEMFGLAFSVGSWYFVILGGPWALPGWIGAMAGIMLLGIGLGLLGAHSYVTKPAKHRAPDPPRQFAAPTMFLPKRMIDDEQPTRIHGSY